MFNPQGWEGPALDSGWVPGPRGYGEVRYRRHVGPDGPTHDTYDGASPADIHEIKKRQTEIERAVERGDPPPPGKEVGGGQRRTGPTKAEQVAELVALLTLDTIALVTGAVMVGAPEPITSVLGGITVVGALALIVAHVDELVALIRDEPCLMSDDVRSVLETVGIALTLLAGVAHLLKTVLPNLPKTIENLRKSISSILGGAKGSPAACNAGAVVRTTPRNLAEKLALEEAKGGAGKQIMQGRINDPRYPEGLWRKMQHVHEHPDGTKTVIHYWENLQTGLREGFKFK